jgi:putative redox protein
MADITVSSDGFLRQRVRAGRHEFYADEPSEIGGADSGPDPYALLLAALGTCTAMTLQLYAKRKGWRLDRIDVNLRHGRVHARDCERCEDPASKAELIERDIHLTGDLSEEQRERLLSIAQRCPVHRTLTSTITITDRLR